MHAKAETAPLSPEMRRYAELDQRLLAAVRNIRILPTVSWPASVEERLIEEFGAGRLSLPDIRYHRPELGETRRELEAIEAEACEDHPIAEYLRRTAESWRIATQMLDAAGTDGVTEASVLLYGRPGDAIPGSSRSNLDAAAYFVNLADELGADLETEDAAGHISAEELRRDMTAKLDAFFAPGTIAVEVDPELTAKAAAGATRIRLRGGARFTEYDRHQLLAHEAFVHSLTALNGREQPVLASLARTSPRVTATQEGLAVFAELMSGSIDIARLKRISLRILAIEKALQGADFIEVFRYFRKHGQNARDSFTSAQRVFRGVPLSGGAAFTKDNVYLAGLLTVHTFFRWAFKRRRLDLLHNLFAGKFALEDVILLAPCFADGMLVPSKYLPPWVQSAQGLAGKLAFSLFANRIRMGRIGEWD